MLEIKWLGTLMTIPALTVALIIIYSSRKSTEKYLNIAVFFWIAANSYWMVMEFFYNSIHKNLAGIFFGLGFMFVGVYYWKSLLKKGMPVPEKAN